MRDAELTQAEADSHSLFILGGARQNSSLGLFAEEWPGRVFPEAGTFTVHDATYTSTEDCALFVGRNPFNRNKTIAILAGLSAEAVSACSRKVIHYGNYGYVVFKAGQAVDKGTWEVRAYPRRAVHVIATR